MTDFNASTRKSVILRSAGLLDARDANSRFPGGSGSGGSTITHYSLAAFDSTHVRYYWTDTSVSFTNAPTPAGSYVPATLTVLGQF